MTSDWIKKHNPHNNPYIRAAISWAEFQEQGILDVAQFSVTPPPQILNESIFRAKVFCTAYKKSGKGMHVFLGSRFDERGYLFRGFIQGYTAGFNHGDFEKPHFTGAKYLLWGGNR